MVQQQNVEFAAEDDVILRGWLFVRRPWSSSGHHDGPRFAGVKEHGLERFAQVFAAAGFVVLVHDHRGFGASGGSPRYDIDLRVQIADWRRAISFLKANRSWTPTDRPWAAAMPAATRSCWGPPTRGWARWSPRCPPSAGISRACDASPPTRCPRWRRSSPTTNAAVSRRATGHPGRG